MKLKYKISITNVADEIIAVPLESTDEFDGVLTINETMKEIIELLEEERTEEELISLMKEKYEDASSEVLAKDIHEICIGLKNEGLLN